MNAQSMDQNPFEKDWAHGAPEKLPNDMNVIETMLLPSRIIDSGLLRQYYMTPDTEMRFIDVLSLATGNLSDLGVNSIKKRQRFNLLKSVIDAYCAMVVQVPSIDVTTTGGSFKQRRSGEALGLFIDGVFAASDMKGISWHCVIDSCLSRVAAVRVDEDGEGGIEIRRILPHQLKWNPAEGADPRHLFVEYPVARAELMEKYGDDPKMRIEIERAMQYKPDPLFVGIDGIISWGKTDMVGVFEAWRTAGPDGKDGRHVIAIRSDGDTAALVDEEYKLQCHQVVPLRFGPSYASFAGSPAGDTLMHYQAELDDFAETIKEHFVKGGVLRVLVDKGSEIDEKELNNEQGQIVHHNAGKAPVFDRGSAPTPEFMNREQTLIERAHEFMGISYNAARGVKADGISSAKGQREVAALAQNRLILNMQTIQDWFVKIGKTIIAIADNKYEGKKEISVRIPGNKLLNRVTWKEIGYKEEEYTIHCDAINSLSRHPVARLEEILEIRQAIPNEFSEEDAMRALGNKDLLAVRDEVFSNEDFAEMIIDLALEGDLRMPDPYMGQAGLQMVVDKGQKRYVQEMVQKKPSEYLNVLRQLIEASKTLLADMAPPPAPPTPATPGAAPGAPPMAVGGAGLPSALPPAAMPPPVPGQGLA